MSARVGLALTLLALSVATPRVEAPSARTTPVSALPRPVPVEVSRSAGPQGRSRLIGRARTPLTARVDSLGPGHPASLRTITAYTWTGSRTASGAWPTIGMAASNLYPLGTRLWIVGYGKVTVTDRVGCCTEIDLFLPTQRMCDRWGRRKRLVWVLR